MGTGVKGAERDLAETERERRGGAVIARVILLRVRSNVGALGPPVGKVLDRGRDALV